MNQPLRAVRFQRAMAPYEAMDIAGFSPAKAEDLVDRGIAEYWPPVAASAPAAAAVDILAGMDRPALLAYAKEHLGTADEPPATVTDDALRTAIRDAVNPETLVAKPVKPKK